MKFWIFLFLFIGLLNCAFGQAKEQPLRNLFNEFHASVNHELGTGFFGGGLAANHVFRPDKIVSFRTGLDFQFFHNWSDSENSHSYYTSVKDIHYSYVDLTIPIVLRINIRWVFIELGVNLGVGIAGQRRATVTSYNDQPPFVVETTTKGSWNPGISVGPVLGIGALIPLNEKLDLLIRPDVGLSGSFTEDFSSLYGRLCVGIHLK
jgi:hypothetical protein